MKERGEYRSPGVRALMRNHDSLDCKRVLQESKKRWPGNGKKLTLARMEVS